VEIEDAHLFIAGAPHAHASGEYFATTDPATGEPLAKAARCQAEDVDLAVRSAADAFLRWQRVSPSDRGRVLMRIAAAIRENAAVLAHTETLDNGKPLSQAEADIEISARYFEFYGGLADKMHGSTIPLGHSHHCYTVPEPFGVTAHVLPWNAPLHQAARALAPALATGNTAVAKPAEATPLTCLALARLAVEAGLPPGALNVVPGYGREAGASLVAHPLVRKVTFTGSTRTGREVMRSAGDRLIPLTLELGGKSPNIIFADADLGAAVAGAWRAVNHNAGQVCSAGSRLLVEASVHDEVLGRLAEINARSTIGPGIEDPDIGALTTTEQLERVTGYIELGIQEGAEVVSGGDRPSEPRLQSGNFVEPTIFARVDNDMRIAREEIFGPVLCVIAFEGEEEAVRIANDSSFGLVAGVWTESLRRAHAVAAALEVGTVFVNDWFAGGVQAPFGGVKESGYGREKGVAAAWHYVQSKTVTVRL
jgi:aldehyde dehydrogenase (NAD+)